MGIRTLSVLFHDSGLPRAASAVLASLILAEAPLSTTQLSVLLGITHGTVSRAVGYLERISVLYRQTIRRQDRYSVESDVWSRLLELNAQRNTRWLAAARHCLDEADIGPRARERLTVMARFFRRLGADMGAASSNTTDETSHQVATLLSALVHCRAPLPVPRLLDSLGWPAQRLQAVLTWLEENPDALAPLTIRVTGAGLLADAHPDALPQPVRRALGADRAAR
ncbi:GbsR/MarR family transcriptional regulator [Micromonospora sp. KC721]|uniref:GbsR/MarR family transcriptional regulator n=1 Tax=Micromonospora sp. KC721 TaxID=2530380 RepID=UPI001FB60DB9|nr:MarR family transcriptional regulator [Micromonospora sp. KC721]